MSVYANDSSLPAQPLPMLNVTCEFIRHEIRPFCPEDSLAETDEAVTAMKAQGQPFQKALQEFIMSRGGNASWLRPFLDERYLGNRAPLPRSSYFLELATYTWQTEPLAGIIVALAQFLQRVGRGDLPPERGSDGPLSMDSLRSMAYTRVPNPNCDILVPSPLTGRLQVAVVHEGHWFVMNVSDASGRISTVEAVSKALSSIRRLAPNIPKEPPIGAMTVVDRNTAADFRAGLLAHRENRMNLAAIQDSLCIVSLAETGSFFQPEFTGDLLDGPAVNRFYDKSIQIVEGAGGKVGLNIEHAGCDGDLWGYALETMEPTLADPYFFQSGKHEPPNVRHLPFFVDSTLAGALAGVLAEQQTGYNIAAGGASLPTTEALASHQCDRDALVQLAIQTAHFWEAGEMASVVHEFPSRVFYEGRSNFLRPASMEALAFSKALVDREDAARVRELLVPAMKEYQKRRERCRDGMGPDSHVLGLEAMAEILSNSQKGLVMPALLSSPVWLKATQPTLKTAALPYRQVNHYGFAPACEDGAGIGYITDADAVRLTAATRPDAEPEAAALLARIEAVLKSLREVLA